MTPTFASGVEIGSVNRFRASEVFVILKAVFKLEVVVMFEVVVAFGAVVTFEIAVIFEVAASPPIAAAAANVPTIECLLGIILNALHVVASMLELR